MAMDLEITAELTSPGTITGRELQIRRIVRPFDAAPWNDQFTIEVADGQQKVWVFLTVLAAAGTTFTLTLKIGEKLFLTWTETMEGTHFQGRKQPPLP